MFGLGMPEILLILAIALIVIGPKKLPDLAKTLGRAMGEFKTAAQDFKRSIDLESTGVKKVNDPPVTLKESLREAVDAAQATEKSGAEPGKDAGDNGPAPGKDSKDTAEK